MARPPVGRRLLIGLAVATILSVATGLGPVALRPAVAAEPALGSWTGRMDLYRSGQFTTQRSWLWCTAAGVQIVRNMVEDKTDHRTASQRTYFAWMRRHNRYTLPVSAGVDPAGWTAGLRHFVDDRYRLVASRSFDAALRSAVTRMRLTGLPVALTVSHGGHGWILSGFSATADPATTTDFDVTSVRVVGPLYGLQSKDGYDLKPGTSMSVKRLRHFFTPWHYDPMPMIWDGRYVSIQPVPAKAAATSRSTPTASADPVASPTGSVPTVSSDAPSTPEPTVATPGPVAAANVPTPGPSPVATDPLASSDEDSGLVPVVLITGLAVIGVVLAGMVRWRHAVRGRRT